MAEYWIADLLFLFWIGGYCCVTHTTENYSQKRQRHFVTGYCKVSELRVWILKEHMSSQFVSIICFSSLISYFPQIPNGRWSSMWRQGWRAERSQGQETAEYFSDIYGESKQRWYVQKQSKCHSCALNLNKLTIICQSGGEQRWIFTELLWRGKYPPLVYTTQVNSAFRAIWLVPQSQDIITIHLLAASGWNKCRARPISAENKVTIWELLLNLYCIY